ncbi:MAG: galactose ABC transporter substrate-binding protein [Lachnospiraceae bacterium]|nr:galactose ABC transporter substrate-binding protein [Lachnospiraceae bacterium]
MKVKKSLALGMAACMGMQLLCACSRQRTDKIEKVQMGVTCYDQSDTFISSVIDSLKEQLGQYQNEGVTATVTVMDAAGLQRTQNDQIEELISSGCNVLCVNLVDRTDPSEIIDLARKNNVPIIFFNREPVAEDMLQWSELYYVGAYAEQSGVLQGELAAEAIKADNGIDRNRDGKIQYVVLEGEPGHQDAIIRTETAVNTLKENGILLEKLSYGIANWSRAQAQNRMTQMIGQHGDKIELVLGNNDDMVLGAIDTYEKLNFTKASWPVFFGIDGTDVGLEAVLDGRLAGTVYNDKEGQAGAMVKLAVALVIGEGMDEIEFEDDRYIYLPYRKVTSGNAGEFLAE